MTTGRINQITLPVQRSTTTLPFRRTRAGSTGISTRGSRNHRAVLSRALTRLSLRQTSRLQFFEASSTGRSQPLVQLNHRLHSKACDAQTAWSERALLTLHQTGNATMPRLKEGKPLLQTPNTTPPTIQSTAPGRERIIFSCMESRLFFLIDSTTPNPGLPPFYSARDPAPPEEINIILHTSCRFLSVDSTPYIMSSSPLLKRPELKGTINNGSFPPLIINYQYSLINLKR